MGDAFEDDELLFRAVMPQGVFIKDNGEYTSAVFRDRAGLSTDRQMGRERTECVFRLACSKQGGGRDIISVSVGACRSSECNAYVEHDPVKGALAEDENPYHTLIKQSKDKLQLTRKQAKYLVGVATKEYQT